MVALLTLLDRAVVPLLARLSDGAVCTLSLVSTVGFRVGELGGPSWSQPLHFPTTGSRVLRIDGSPISFREPFVRLPTHTWRWRVRRAPPRTSRDLCKRPDVKTKTSTKKPGRTRFWIRSMVPILRSKLRVQTRLFVRSVLGRTGRSGIGLRPTGLPGDVPGLFGVSFPFKFGSKGKRTERDSRIDVEGKPRHNRRYDMANVQECYARLGLAPHATPEEVKAAYLEQVRKLHPDVAPAHRKREAEQAFKEIGEAYALLVRKPKQTHHQRKYGSDGVEFRARKAAHAAAEARKGGISLAVLVGILAIPCVLGGLKIHNAQSQLEQSTWRKNGLLYPPVNPFLSNEKMARVQKRRSHLVRDLLFPNR